MRDNTFILPDHAQEGRRAKSVERSQFMLDEDALDLGKGKTYFIRTYGCAANVRDGETIAGLLEAMGFQRTADEKSADVLIFNTCAVRGTSEEHVFGEIGTLKPWKQQHPEKILALCGCMAQEESVVEAILKTYRQVDLVFGTHNLDALPRLLAKAMRGEKAIEVKSEQGGIVEDLPVNRSSVIKGFVNIAYGCDKFCTYCIVPYTRGKERSRLMPYILDEIRQFEQRGGKEVMLLGQNVNSWGKDLRIEDGFTKLLIAAAQTGIRRIRFDSSHPRDYSETTIDAMRDYENIMPSLHLAVQSGSDTVLQRMNRGYTIEHYKELFDTMKAKIPSMTFSTDLIVGFPQESDEEFQKTLDLVDYCRFDQVYSFIYSPREGTPAAAMEDDVSRHVKEERLQELNRHINHWAYENNQNYLNRTLEVLCEGPSKKRADVLAGYSREFKLVNFTGRNVKAGDIVQVKITGAKSFSLDGVAIE